VSESTADSTIEIESIQPGRSATFRREHEREALSTEWGFPIVWHEQRHEFAATTGDTILAVLTLRIAASLAHIDSLIVAPTVRRRRLGARLLERAEVTANYYNCHKVTVETPSGSAAERFFLASGYKIEATLPQHTWKLDVTVLRKFLL